MVDLDWITAFQQAHEPFEVRRAELPAHEDCPECGVLDADLAFVVTIEFGYGFRERRAGKNQEPAAPTQIILDVGQRAGLNEDAGTAGARDIAGSHDDLT